MRKKRKHVPQISLQQSVQAVDWLRENWGWFEKQDPREALLPQGSLSFLGGR